MVEKNNIAFHSMELLKKTYIKNSKLILLLTAKASATSKK